VLIDYTQGIMRVVSQVQAWFDADDELGISAVQIAEFFSGVATVDFRTWTSLLEAYERWQINDVVARRAGKYRYDFARRGIQISIPDALIAAVARDRSATLVTRNVRDFPMTDIRIVAL
jgi:predicted nucleic acid-binding protein